jgi:hypothetical protein
MSCNLAVSITKAAVTKKELLALLTVDVVEKVVLTYLQQQYPNLSPCVFDQSENYVSFVIGKCYVIIQDGDVRVEEYYGNTAKADALANEVAQVLSQLADALFQQQLQKSLGNLVTNVQTVNVDNEGVTQQATVFTLEF